MASLRDPAPVARPDSTPPAGVVFPDPESADEHGRVFVVGDYEPETLLAAYRAGLFPMRLPSGELAWWSPEPRGILTPERLHVSASLRRARRRFVIKVDTAFDAVTAACSERDEGEYHWITPEVRGAYGELHRRGWAHSVEVWSIPAAGEPSRLVGGLYGVAIGGLFSGESMFHWQRDASKVALVALVDLLRADGRNGAERLIDVQWLTPHMASLGAFEVSRRDYLRRLEAALALPPPAFQR